MSRKPVIPTAEKPMHDLYRVLGRCDIGDCWEFRGHLNQGYGRATVGTPLDGSYRQVLVHRFVYEQLVGAIPKEKHLDHLCRNRKCCNPDHLEPVDPKTNTHRGAGVSAKNARKTHCNRGHDLNEAYVFKPTGQRQCRKCARLYDKKRRPRKRVKSGTFSQ